MLVILVAAIIIGGCFVSWNSLYTPNCELEQEIQSQYLLHPKIPDVNAVIDFTPTTCDFNPPIPSPMQTITNTFGWDHNFCLGKNVVIQTWFMNDGYGCGELGNLIIHGPSLQIYYKNRSP